MAGLDLAPRLLDAARARVRAEGLEIDWREGDAENLPFDDGSFDSVLSTFGHMFAPRHQQTAREMAPVCRRGGVIVTATWTPEGVFGELSKTAASYMPPPPDYASPPPLWGREDHVRELFGHVATGFEFERHVNRIEWESVDAFAGFFMSRFPPLVTAKAMLGERFSGMRERIVDIWRRRSEATDGRLLLPQEYLISVVRL